MQQTRSISVFLLAAALSPQAPAQTPTLVKDINAQGYVVDSTPQLGRIGYSARVARDFLKVGSRCFFKANSGMGPELHVTDGTRAGTRQVADISSGTLGSDPFDMVASNGVVYFSAGTPALGRELYRSDGTAAGTVLVKDINPGVKGSNPGNLCPLAGGRIVFSATNATSGTELWVSNGTAAGTRLLKDLDPGAADSSPKHCFPMRSGKALFSASNRVTGREMYITDGTAPGTTLLKDIRPGQLSSLPVFFTRVGSSIVFRADDGSSGNELWQTDGTTAGTKLLKDIASGASGSWPDMAYAQLLGGSLYFAAIDQRGSEVWKTDGTAAGTMLVKDVRSGPSSSQPSWFTRVGSDIFFAANDGFRGIELWKTDGTSAGTRLVKDLNLGRYDAEPRALTAFQGKLYFSALVRRPVVTGRELYCSDGTSAGTTLVKDLAPGSSSQPKSLTVIHSRKMIFSADDVVAAGVELFETDGTAQGTKLFKDLRTDPRTLDALVADSVEMGGELYFRANDGLSGAELWKTDGTAAGTKRIVDLVPGREASSPSGMIVYKDELYFAADGDKNHRRELWKSDGSAAGTKLVADIAPGLPSSSPSDFCVYNGKLYFSAFRRDVGRELFVTDGTAVGTKLVKNLTGAADSSGPSDLTVYRGKLYFSAWTGASGRELFESDGTNPGTKIAVDIWSGRFGGNPSYIELFRGKLVFAANSNNGRGVELYESDGTVVGTRMLKDLNPGESGSFPRYLVNADGTLFMEARQALVGSELFKSDGTSAGTVLAIDINPGSTSSDLKPLTRRKRFLAIGKRILFSALERRPSVRGHEPYISDGTLAGTRHLADIAPGSASSWPQNAAIAGGKIFFTAGTATLGRELYVGRSTRASAIAFGASCGPNYPTLRSTAPVLGGAARLSGTSHLPNGIGVLFTGSPGSKAKIFSCTEYVGLATAIHTRNVLADASKNYAAQIAIPSNTALVSIKANVQVLWLTVPTVLPLETTNAVQLTLGN